jgi:AraC-like DNA-binding protein
VTEGELWAGIYGQPPVRVGAGDVVVIPRGDPYYLAANNREPPLPKLEDSVGMLGAHVRHELPFSICMGGGGAQTGLICGFLACDDRPFNPLLESLPQLVVVRRAEEPALGERLRGLIDLTLAESRAGVPGGSTVRTRLSELLFVELVRRQLATASARDSGWLAALADDVVGRALGLLHQRPAEPWSLHALAREVGSSRSVLADRFKRMLGQAPMQYLTRWRMQLAASQLVEGRRKVSAVAIDVGYDSEAAFSRAFRRETGVAPGSWRGHALRGARG